MPVENPFVVAGRIAKNTFGDIVKMADAIIDPPVVDKRDKLGTWEHYQDLLMTLPVGGSSVAMNKADALGLVMKEAKNRLLKNPKSSAWKGLAAVYSELKRQPQSFFDRIRSIEFSTANPRWSGSATVPKVPVSVNRVKSGELPGSLVKFDVDVAASAGRRPNYMKQVVKHEGSHVYQGYPMSEHKKLAEVLLDINQTIAEVAPNLNRYSYGLEAQAKMMERLPFTFGSAAHQYAFGQTAKKVMVSAYQDLNALGHKKTAETIRQILLGLE